jgi:ABC-type thiamine transport system ATPase subunit
MKCAETTRLKKVKGRLKDFSHRITKFANKMAEVHGNRYLHEGLSLGGFIMKDYSPDKIRNVALVGHGSSGKTSLCNLLPRFYDYTGGRILLDGQELTAYSREYLRKHIGIVEQEPFLFSRSIRENIAYGVGRDVTQEEIEKAQGVVPAIFVGQAKKDEED